MQYRESHNSIFWGITLIICPGAESATAIILKNGITKNRIRTTTIISPMTSNVFSSLNLRSTLGPLSRTTQRIQSICDANITITLINAKITQSISAPLN